MAKNIFENLLKLTGFNPPNKDGYYDPSVYRQETKPVKAAPPAASGTPQLSRVEQYLAKKQGIEQPTSNSEQLTGVARYLAQKEQTSQAQTESKQAELAAMTGVERYLAQKQGGAQKPASKPASNTKKLTGVDKYLADKKKVSPAVAKPTPPKPAAKTAPAKASPESKKAKAQPKAAVAEPVVEEPAKEKAKPAAKKAVKESTIDLAATADQCQAATQKGSRCRRKSNLEAIKQSINSQPYRFAVCSQHNNDDFVPFAELIQ